LLEKQLSHLQESKKPFNEVLSKLKMTIDKTLQPIDDKTVEPNSKEG
jgi:peptidoglycan hydrolase CwlO-like protein